MVKVTHFSQFPPKQWKLAPRYRKAQLWYQVGCYYCWLCAFEDPTCPWVHFLSSSLAEMCSLKCNPPWRLMNRRPSSLFCFHPCPLSHWHTCTLTNTAFKPHMSSCGDGDACWSWFFQSQTPLQIRSVCFLNPCHVHFKLAETLPEWKHAGLNSHALITSHREKRLCSVLRGSSRL